jgi:hypothetical protein
MPILSMGSRMAYKSGNIPPDSNNNQLFHTLLYAPSVNHVSSIHFRDILALTDSTVYTTVAVIRITRGPRGGRNQAVREGP